MFHSFSSLDQLMNYLWARKREGRKSENDMRNFSHLSLRYVLDRMQERAYQKQRPEMPWLTPAACEALRDVLRSTDTVLEFGSGRSTKWLAKHVKRVISIEHNPAWHAKVYKDLKVAGLSNVDLHLVEEGGCFISDVNALVAEVSVDVFLVDGIQRDECALLSLEKIRSGGVIILDDSQRYLPSDSRAPEKLDPNQVNPLWLEFRKKIENWRKVPTTSGVSDTTFIFAP